MSSPAEPLYHIARAADWEAARRRGAYRLSTRGATLADVGFIHASFRSQVERIGGLVYGDVDEPLVVLAIDPRLVGAPIRYESVAGGDELFPHIYGPLPTTAVTSAFPARSTGTGGIVVEGLPAG